MDTPTVSAPLRLGIDGACLRREPVGLSAKFGLPAIALLYLPSEGTSIHIRDSHVLVNTPIAHLLHPKSWLTTPWTSIVVCDSAYATRIRGGALYQSVSMGASVHKAPNASCTRVRYVSRIANSVTPLTLT
jgi:hypothetical protein